MVIGLFIITAIPTVTGISQAYSAQKTAEEREKDKKRMAKFHIDLVCDAHKPRSKELNGRRVVLKDDLVCVGAPDALNPSPEGYVAEAFYIEYPDKEVSTDLRVTFSGLFCRQPLTFSSSARPCSTWSCQPDARRPSALELDISGQEYSRTEVWEQDCEHRAPRGSLGLDKG